MAAGGGEQPWLLSGTGVWALGRSASLTAGLLGSSRYQGVGWGLDWRLGRGSGINLRNLYSLAPQDGWRGAQMNASFSTSLGQSFALSASASRQSAGYRDLMDVVLRSPTQASYDWGYLRSQYSGFLSWNSLVAGSFSMGYSHAESSSGAPARRLTGSWGYSFGSVSLTLGVERGLDADRYGALGNSVYFSLSAPLGRGSARAYARDSGGGRNVGASYSEQVNERFGYGISADTELQSRRRGWSVNAGLASSFAQSSLSFSQSGPQQRSYAVQVRGGMALHKNGITLSPYAIGDTFGIVSAGGMAGLRIATRQGSVWTDPWGRAVIASVPAYQTSSVQIQTQSLPKNVDVKNGLAQLRPGRGAITHVQFEVVTVRRILLHARGADGADLPANSYVLDQDGNFITMVLDKGTVFLHDDFQNKELHVRDVGGGACKLEFALPAQAQLDSFYEQLDGICR